MSNIQPEEIINQNILVKLHNREQTIIKISKLLLQQDTELNDAYLREKSLEFQCSVKDLEISNKLLELAIPGKKGLIEKYKVEITILNKSLANKQQIIASLKDELRELKFNRRQSNFHI